MPTATAAAAVTTHTTLNVIKTINNTLNMFIKKTANHFWDIVQLFRVHLAQLPLYHCLHQPLPEMQDGRQESGTESRLVCKTQR